MGDERPIHRGGLRGGGGTAHDRHPAGRARRRAIGDPLAGGVQRLGPGEVAIYKPRWGAFYRTPLEEHLRAQQVSTLVFSGCNYPNCPRASIYEASERDFRLVLARGAISGLYERGERELADIGVHLMSTAAVLDALSAAVA